jgi:phosphate transport system permease protein
MGINTEVAPNQSTNQPNGFGMPEGDEQDSQVSRRNRRARTWMAVFQLALVVAIVALIALLYSIVNDSFGLAAVENAIDPSQLMAGVQEQRMLAAPNTTTSEDDEVIAAAVAANPYAIGFLGYAYYGNHADTLTLLNVDGVAPNVTTVESGEYPLARPLFLYANGKSVANKPEVAAFLDYYLRHVNDVIGDVGYFAASDEALAGAHDLLLNAATEGIPDAIGNGQIAVAGSSTVHPLTLQIANDFREIEGFTGAIAVDSTGTKAGYARLCDAQDADIVGSSRAMTRQELAACEDLRVRPLELRIGSDAVAVVVSTENDFLTNVTSAELEQIFSGAERWSDVNSAWPDEAIVRVIPGADSGTLDFMAASIVSGTPESLTPAEMVPLIEANVSAGVFRRLESEMPFAERSQADIYQILEARVIQPRVVASWSMTASLLRRDEIEVEALSAHPDAEIVWYRWLSRDFLTQPQSSIPEQAGVRTAILGSLWVVLITILVAVPIGIGTAIYLEEYASHSRLHRVIQTNIDNLAGVPSIIYGILGLAIFVRALEGITSGSALGVSDPTTANGRTVLSAGLTLALLVLPVVIINAQEAIRAVPSSLREAGYGLGATKWQVVWTHVLANALPGIFTGTILAMSRALGETAPLIVIGASTFITQDPTGPYSKFTVLPMQIYQWTSRPQAEFKHIAAAASLVLLVLLLMLNGSAIYLRNRFSKTF